MANLPLGYPFAPRNEYALKLIFLKSHHYCQASRHDAATWLLHPDAPKIEIPQDLKVRLESFRKVFVDDVKTNKPILEIQLKNTLVMPG